VGFAVHPSHLAEVDPLWTFRHSFGQGPVSGHNRRPTGIRQGAGIGKYNSSLASPSRYAAHSPENAAGMLLANC
jgi:hypothetical protein